MVLTRDIPRLWREAGLLDRVRITNGQVRVIAPTRQIAAGVPIDAGVEWLALEDRFRLRGEAISFLGAPGIAVARRKNDPTAPVHGPFSADFRLVYLDGEDCLPIRCTKAQADVFRALWEFEGKDRSAEDVMTRTGRKSAKPIDVFKAHPEPKRAYEVLVETNQKEGLYQMPCAARRPPPSVLSIRLLLQSSIPTALCDTRVTSRHGRSFAGASWRRLVRVSGEERGKGMRTGAVSGAVPGARGTGRIARNPATTRDSGQ